MPPIRLTYGNAALAWGRDQARSAKALATDGERTVTRALPSADRSAIGSPSGSRAPSTTASASASASPSATAAASASSLPTPAPAPTASAGNRFARLLADIAEAQPDNVDETVAQDQVPLSASPKSGTAAGTQLALAMRAATERARQFAANASPGLPLAVSIAAAKTLTNQSEDLAAERRSQLEDVARRIALTTPRGKLKGSPQLTVAYDQVGVARGIFERRG